MSSDISVMKQIYILTARTLSVFSAITVNRVVALAIKVRLLY